MIIIAHRANGFGFPENSPAAVRACLDAGFVPEIDLCGDDRGPVLTHDAPAPDSATLADTIRICRNPLRRARHVPVLCHLKDTRARDAMPANDWFRPVTFGRPGLGAMFVEADREAETLGVCGGVVCADDDEWLRRDIVARLQASGVTVLAAGRNIFARNPARWAALHAMGVDGMLTDVPRAADSFFRTWLDHGFDFNREGRSL